MSFKVRLLQQAMSGILRRVGGTLTCSPRLPRSSREFTGLVFVFFGFGSGKRAGRGALKLLKRPAREVI